MIKTKQQSAIGKVWNDINRNWGVAVGFLLLLFLIPVTILVSSPTSKQTTKTSADSSRPLVKISPSKGQSDKQIFIADVSDNDVDQLDNVEVWWGANTPQESKSNGNFATISLKNYSTPNSNFDWRANVYSKTASGLVTNITTLLPDDSNSSLSKVCIVPSTKSAEIIMTANDDASATSCIKFRRVVKTSNNSIQFYLQTEFKNNFSPKDLNVYMYAKRSIQYGGNTSQIGDSLWTKVGTWNSSPSAINLLTSNNPPKYTSIPSTKAKVGVEYRYTINATDAENDSLTYKIYSSPTPKFLTINSNVLSGTPSASDIGAASIVVIVTDSYGNNATQSWTINVEANNTGTSPAPAATTVVITSPTNGSKFSGNNNSITWTLSSSSGVANMRISYTPTGSTNDKVIATIDPSKNQYTWDSSSLSNGSYIVKVEALDTNQKVISAATSPSVAVDNTVNDSLIVAPKLSGKSPEGVVSDLRPVISASILAGSTDIDMTTLKVTLDNEDISTKLDKGVNSFSYKPLQDISTGNHQVVVKVSGKDARNGKGTLNDSWTFTVDIAIPGTNNSESTSKSTKVRLPIINIEVDQWLGTLIIGFFVILLFILLIIAIILLIRLLKNKDDDEVSQITKYYQTDQPQPLPSSDSAALAGAAGTSAALTNSGNNNSTASDPFSNTTSTSLPNNSTSSSSTDTFGNSTSSSYSPYTPDTSTSTYTSTSAVNPSSGDAAQTGLNTNSFDHTAQFGNNAPASSYTSEPNMNGMQSNNTSSQYSSPSDNFSNTNHMPQNANSASTFDTASSSNTPSSMASNTTASNMNYNPDAYSTNPQSDNGYLYGEPTNTAGTAQAQQSTYNSNNSNNSSNTVNSGSSTTPKPSESTNSSSAAYDPFK